MVSNLRQRDKGQSTIVQVIGGYDEPVDVWEGRKERDKGGGFERRQVLTSQREALVERFEQERGMRSPG